MLLVNLTAKPEHGDFMFKFEVVILLITLVYYVKFSENFIKIFKSFKKNFDRKGVI